MVSIRNSNDEFNQFLIEIIDELIFESRRSMNNYAYETILNILVYNR